ncbi:MAG: radical SAM protein [Candidatus Thermoplasmatota archaeon]|nr:radical SAM protein [Candidatus Thermoplasmatota archaeon]
MGYKIVLTADRTLMSEYNNDQFIGFAACSPSFLPTPIYKSLFCPSVPCFNGIPAFAHCGLRKIEASLLENGFSEKEVVVGHPEHLNKVINKDTMAIGITTNDPLGLGPASSTFSSLCNNETYTAIYFRKLVTNKLIRRYDSKVIVGGPGAWQLEDERIRAKLGIDCIVIDEGELVAPWLFRKAVNNEHLPPIVHGDVVPVEKIPTIRNPTVNGLVEIARGCGRGCKFCNPTMLKVRYLPIEKILEEVKINVKAHKKRGTILHAEDVLRYKAKGVVPNEEEVLRLFSEVKKITSDIGISHFSLAAVVAKPNLIEELSNLLGIGSSALPWYSGQTGIETGSPNLANEHLAGKAKPFDVKEWPNIVEQAFQILKDNNWVPCATLVMGLPKETEEDVIKTRELVQDLRGYKSLVVPLFFVPIGNLVGERFFTAKDMTSEHWKLFAACWRHNFYWLSALIEEHFKMRRINTIKLKVVQMVRRYAERKLERYIKLMEEGKNPIKVAA